MTAVLKAGAFCAAIAAAVLASDQEPDTLELRLAAAPGVRLVEGPEGDPERRTCGTRAEIFGALAREYHEAPVAAWHLSERALMTLLGSDDGTTWTLVLSTPDGAACIAQDGDNWRPLVEGLGAPES